MVGPETNSRDRGQIILIGAITLAFIVLGIVVVFNGILYTEALSSGSSSQSASDINTIEHELASSVGGIAHYESIEGGNEDPDSYENNLTEYINGSGEFGDQYRHSTANSRPVITNVSSNETVEDATIITEDVEDGEIDEIESLVGHFELNLTQTANDEQITINATTEEGESSIVRIEENDGNFTVDGGDCEIEGDHVRFDLVAGDVNLRLEDDCDPDEIEEVENALSIIDPNESYEKIEMSGDEYENTVEGTFEFVVKGWDENGILELLNIGGENGEAHYGAWSVSVDVIYESHDSSYERTQTINVYGGNG